MSCVSIKINDLEQRHLIIPYFYGFIHTATQQKLTIPA
jgi:hypothetical protein